MSTLCTLQGRTITQGDDLRVHYIADGDIDMDGANGQSDPILAAYRPGNTGIEHLANAGYPSYPQYYRNILVCDLRDRPIQQREGDPAPGAYICMTAYEWPDLARTNPRKYVDAATVPYIVVSPVIRQAAKGIVLGCRARVTNRKTGARVDCIVADIGPRSKVGELSYAAAKRIGINPSPRVGGTQDMSHLLYELWPGTPAQINGVTYQLHRMG